MVATLIMLLTAVSVTTIVITLKYFMNEASTPPVKVKIDRFQIGVVYTS